MKCSGKEKEGQHSLHNNCAEIDLQQCTRERVEQMPIRYRGIDFDENERHDDAHDEEADRMGEWQVFVIDPAQHRGQRQQNGG